MKRMINNIVKSTVQIFKILLFPAFGMMTLFFHSCEKPVEWELKEKSVVKPVVNCILTNELKYQEVKLSLPTTDLNTPPVPLSGCYVTVGNGSRILKFEEDSLNPGTYKSPEKIAIPVNGIYYLTFLYDGVIYSSVTTMIPVNVSPLLEYQPVDGKPGFYEITRIAPEYSPDEQAMYEVDIDWSHLSGALSPDSVTRAGFYHYTLGTIDVSYMIFPQDREKIYFPAGSRIIEKKYSLTDEYATYLRALLAETEWQGSLFEDARANLPSNISNGGLGFFAACSVISDTIYVEP